MKPSNLIQATSDKPYSNEALNNSHLESNPLRKIYPWLVVLASLSVMSALFMATVGMPHNIKQTHFEEPVVAAEKTIITTNKFTDAFIWTTKLKLEDLKLNHRLQVSANNANDLVIKGNISKEEADNWQAFLNWYASKEGFPNLKHHVETSAISSNIPELKSVWFDKNPTAYFIDGRSGNIGTAFEDGWRIVSIEAWAVFVERNGTTVMLQY